MADKILLDPKQSQCVQYYKDPASPTFGNFKQSLIRAGYSEKYADTHYNKDVQWIEHAKSTVQSIEQSEENLKRINSKEVDIADVDKISKSKMEFLKLQSNVSMFVLKTLARSKYEPESEKADTNIQVNIIKQGKTVDVEAKEI